LPESRDDECARLVEAVQKRQLECEDREAKAECAALRSQDARYQGCLMWQAVRAGYGITGRKGCVVPTPPLSQWQAIPRPLLEFRILGLVLPQPSAPAQAKSAEEDGADD
jgi:hypothetical protein